ncbi:uncharacterized protein ALTATR162_LOCUS7767 [Alternaria atra]|uniref:AB hydrolase-1 domain-containing protein n=1 Tax=Alternaria atra TaxID=119953 RepID=A0A8J2I5H0_9PLEO|nr:uncharacterized protein ALTATR162_LOCUS7767 [Alternaria atra]CAG5174347.1 unnamed protein product [Alternaria atra]
MVAEEVSPDFPFEKKHVKTLDSFMAYVDTGTPNTAATTVVFVHGNPTSSYLWRNIIPHISPVARCVAPDLVGFGDSGKMPSNGYYIREHAEYFGAFMEAVLPANDKVVLVVHDWGSALGFDWARKNEQRVAGLVFMEFVYASLTAENFVGWDDRLSKMRDPDTGHKLVLEENYFVEVILKKHGTSKGVPEAVMEHYRRPFANPLDREPQWRMPNEIPLEGRAPDVGKMVWQAWEWLKAGNNQVPKLIFWVEPGMLVPPHRVKDVAEWMGNPKVVGLGPSGHFPQEEYPHRIGEETRKFVDNILEGK